MCWSGEASVLLATAGIGTTAYVAYRGEDKSLWIPLGYFSLMEVLQAVSYVYIDQCGSQINHILTVLGYIHIAFQPFFINAICMYFVPKNIRKKIEPFVYTLCFASAVMTLLKMYPFQIVTGVGSVCKTGTILCSQSLCTMSGSWHLAWHIPPGGFPPSTFFYIVFVLPLLYGSWRSALYHFTVGPMLAMMLSRDPHEWPAIYCLISIGIVILVLNKRIRKLLTVNKWYFWKFPQ